MIGWEEGSGEARQLISVNDCLTAFLSKALAQYQTTLPQVLVFCASDPLPPLSLIIPYGTTLPYYRSKASRHENYTLDTEYCIDPSSARFHSPVFPSSSSSSPADNADSRRTFAMIPSDARLWLEV